MVVGTVVVSTGVLGVVGVWVLGSWVDSVVTSVTGWAPAWAEAARCDRSGGHRVVSGSW